jgi:hypothetical protein
MINKSNEMTIEYLRDLFIERYGDSVNYNENVPEVIVIMTREDYTDLYNNLLKSHIGNALLLVDEAAETIPEPGEILFTRIHIPFICEFIIRIGDEFSFELADSSDVYGTEDL